jgi:hypothetical protein
MSASELIEQASAPSAITKEREAKRSYPKTHANYWKARLEHRTYTRDGNTYEVPEWSVRIHFGGNRKSFDLETGSKEEAAAQGRRRRPGASTTGAPAPKSIWASSPGWTSIRRSI